MVLGGGWGSRIKRPLPLFGTVIFAIYLYVWEVVLEIKRLRQICLQLSAHAAVVAQLARVAAHMRDSQGRSICFLPSWEKVFEGCFEDGTSALQITVTGLRLCIDLIQPDRATHPARSTLRFFSVSRAIVSRATSALSQAISS